MKILLLSFFNSNNIGDLLLADQMRRVLSRAGQVVCASNEGSFEIQGRYTPTHRGIGTRIANRLCGLMGRQYKTPKQRRFEAQLGRCLESADLMVFGGGNIMMDFDSRSHSARRYLGYMDIAEKKGVKCAALSVGIGPFATERQAKEAVAALNRCAYISFRDRQSLSLFAENGGDASKAVLGMDPAFLLEQVRGGEDKPVIAVNVIYPTWSGEWDPGEVLAGYRRLIEALVRQYPQYRVELYCTEKKDFAGAKQVYDFFEADPRVRLTQVESLGDLLELYGRSAVVIGARMHALITAYSQRCPVVGLIWQNKVRDFFEMIGQRESAVSLAELEKQAGFLLSLVESSLREQVDYEPVLRRASACQEADVSQLLRLGESHGESR